MQGGSPTRSAVLGHVCPLMKGNEKQMNRMLRLLIAVIPTPLLGHVRLRSLGEGSLSRRGNGRLTAPPPPAGGGE